MHLTGLHHITAITTDAAENLAFYQGILGLRLVKRTVNFDDPGTWHLYYGDGAGNPGSIITFFAWPAGHAGKRGTGQAIVASFSIPQVSLGFWIQRLLDAGIPYTGPFKRFDETFILVNDPDGLAVELVAHPRETRAGWDGSTVPADHAIRGLHSATILEKDSMPTMELLTKTLGFTFAVEEHGVARFTTGANVPGTFLDVKTANGLWEGDTGGGTIHHIALRTPDNQEQALWRTHLTSAGLSVSPLLDRQYFRSLYAREPGGVLLEIATDPPGFTIDEAIETLGTALKLPAWLEERREIIEKALPPLDTHTPASRMYSHD